MKTKSIIYLAAISLAIITSCKSKTKESTTDSSATTRTDTDKMDTAKGSVSSIRPNQAAPAWAPDIKPQMQSVIEKLVSYGDKPIETLTATEARKNHTPTDAVIDLMKEHNIPMPVFNVDTMGKDIPVKGGKIHLRIIRRKGTMALFQ